MKKAVVSIFLIFIITCYWGMGQNKTENIILITIDGCRWQEVFTGADSILIRTKEQTHDSAAFVNKYWRNHATERRSILMPFMWSTIAVNGQLYGNRNFGNYVNVSNKMWFSYPGYSELLCGFADDERVNSNNLIPNPNKNVLEFINNVTKFKGKVATFSSWDAFPYIINEQRSGILVNSAFEPVAGKSLTGNEEFMNKVMRKVPEFIGGVRNDAFTFYQAFEYLKKENPRVLYIALDETDDLAHQGRYDLYLNAINYTDEMIAELWDWIQTTPRYKNKTTMLITVDHGRGLGKIEWRNHGAKTPYSDQTWLAVIGPDTPAKGEVKTGTQIFQSQHAATLASLLGLNYTNDKPVGEVIKSITTK